MLNKRVNQRVCQLNQLKNFNFFKNFNWSDLLENKMKPPYKPNVIDYRNNLENCNFQFEEVINVRFLLILV